jgi:hypothetical protein
VHVILSAFCYRLTVVRDLLFCLLHLRFPFLHLGELSQHPNIQWIRLSQPSRSLRMIPQIITSIRMQKCRERTSIYHQPGDKGSKLCWPKLVTIRGHQESNGTSEEECTKKLTRRKHINLKHSDRMRSDRFVPDFIYPQFWN